MVTLICAVIIMRLWHLQVIQYVTLASRAESNRIREITIDGLRGKILDRNGVALVDNRPSFQLSLIPEDIDDPKEVLNYLKTRVSIDENSAATEIDSVKPFQSVALKRDLNREEVAFVEERRINLPGVFLEIKPIRNYMFGEFGAHALGYLGAITEGQLTSEEFEGFSRNDFIGQAGVEKLFESELRGEKGMKRIEVDAAGREINHLGDMHPKSGENLKLTIDFDAQDAAEKAFEGKMGAAVALDPSTGEILAYISKPSYDPNKFAYGVNPADWKYLVEDEWHPLQNRVIQGQYPPGSTFKVVMAAAGLQEGLITPSTTVTCPGYFTYGNRTYRCWKKEGHGTMNVHSALVQSCDVFFYTLGVRMGINRIAQYSRGFGLGEKTNLGFTGEKPGLIPTTQWKERVRKEKWILGETVSCAIGQGYVLTTPIQMARMIAAVANGGKLVSPQIVMGKDNGSKQPPQVPIVSKENLELIRNALRGVVAEPHGTAWALKNGPFEYAGKTGTAQVIRMKQGEVVKTRDQELRFKDHAWFVAFAPFDDPKIAVAVIAEHGGHGGEAAAPIAKAIMDAYLSKVVEPKNPAPAEQAVAVSPEGDVEE